MQQFASKYLFYVQRPMTQQSNISEAQQNKLNKNNEPPFTKVKCKAHTNETKHDINVIVLIFMYL